MKSYQYTFEDQLADSIPVTIEVAADIEVGQPPLISLSEWRIVKLDGRLLDVKTGRKLGKILYKYLDLDELVKQLEQNIENYILTRTFIRKQLF
jgi:hypothetical protein